MKFILIFIPQQENPAIALEVTEGDAVFSISTDGGSPVPESLMEKIQDVIEEARKWQTSE